MATIPIGQKILAITGVLPFLEGKPLRVTMTQADMADRIQGRIRKSIKRFLTEPALEAPKPVEFDYKRALKLLTEINENRLGDQMQDEASGFAVAALGPVLQHLTSIAPRRSITGLTGTKAIPPSDAEISRFRRAWAIANDPLSILNSLEAGAVSRDQSSDLATMYPAIYDDMREAVFLVLVDVKAQRAKFELSPRKDKALQAFLRTRTWNASLARDMQSAFAAKEDEGEPPRKRVPELAEGAALPTRRIEAR